MQKIYTLENLCGGTVEMVVKGDQNLELKDGNILYKVRDNKNNRVLAYFFSAAEAINYDRYINGFVNPQYVKGQGGFYEENDCYEVASLNS